MNRAALERLSKDNLIALVLAQPAQIEALVAQVNQLTAGVAELEAKLNEPPKTSDNSSRRPSKGEKPNQTERRKARRKRRPDVFRAFAENVDLDIFALPQQSGHRAPAVKRRVHWRRSGRVINATGIKGAQPASTRIYS